MKTILLLMLALPQFTWKQADDFEKQSLPQSALETVNQIREKALQTGNSPELIKAMIYRLKFETTIDGDKLPALIREMEAFAANDGNRAEQAVLHSLLAELYDKYYRSDSYRIGQRTPLPDAAAGEDMETWSANVFISRIAGYAERSLMAAELLQKTAATEYEDILLSGESSRRLRPTLYDLLVHRGINLLKGISDFDGHDFTPQILKLYRELLTFRSRENNAFAWLMVDLDRLDFILNTDDDKSAEYRTALNRLEKQFAAEDFCAEILYRKAIHYYNTDSVKQAYETCREGIEKYPRYERTGLLKNFLRQITQSELTVTGSNTVYPGKEALLKINYRNLDRLTLQIYRINAPAAIYADSRDRSGQYKKNGQPIFTEQIRLANETPYIYSDTTLKIPMKTPGNYEYLIFPEGRPECIANQQFSVSRLATISRATDGKREFMVADLLSGKPITGASIRLYKRSGNRLVETQTLRTDAGGLASGGNESDVVGYQAVYKTDTSLIISNVPWLSEYDYREPTRQLNLFTDRSIYRPGQTVYFKGIVCETEEMRTLSNQVLTVSLYDAGGENITGMTVKTNEWGSFAGEFVLPQGAMNGRFSIGTDPFAATAYFRVEEYKRPTFDIRFEENKNICRFGEKVTIKGNARTFSGVNIRNAKAEYRISRSRNRLFRMWSPPVQVAADSVRLDGAGNFEIDFTPEKAVKDKNQKRVNYTYTVSVSVIDAKGETQNSETQINIGDIPYILSANLPDILNKDSLPALTIEATDLNRNPAEIAGSYRIFILKPKSAGKLDNENADWLQDKLIVENAFESGKAIPLKFPATGKYRIIAEANAAEAYTADFTVYTHRDKRPPAPVYEWLLPVKTECAPGENAVIVYGSSVKKAYVLYEIFKGKENKKVAAARFVLNNENRKIEIPFRESYGDGVSVQFTFIKDAKVFSKSTTILRKRPNRQLNLTTDVFRDQLLPGQREEWKISVKDAGGKGVAGELLAAMYDASLDKIYRHEWSFNPLRNLHLPNVRTENGDGFSASSRNFRIDYKQADVPHFKFDDFNWFGFTVHSQVLRMKSFDLAGGVSAMRKSPAQNVETEQAEAKAPVQIRRNFNETVFFYPQLATGESGETAISFTVPESNTTWKFMALAHTKDLKFGQIAKETVSRKKLMVAVNAPRFIRESDRATISATVSNLSDSTISGVVGIEFFDPETRETTITVPEASRPFTVDAGATLVVSWRFTVPSGIDRTAVKAVAKTAGFSDGEQHLLPVLPSRILVTESLPLDVRGGQTKTAVFDRMRKKSSSRQNHRLTLEFSSNPLRYAVQSLPATATPQSDDVLSWFGVYYVETLRATFPPPHNVNRTNYLRRQALDKLRALQTDGGGWVWFKGMTPSLSITQWILYVLKETGETEAGDMQEKAIRFIDREFKRHYDSYTKHAKSQYPTAYELEYLLVRSLYSDIPLAETEEAFRFYASITEKRWANIPDLYGRAVAALFLQRSGKGKVAQAVVRSLREHASRKPDWGMYWANNRARSFFFNNAVAVHTFIIKAFHETGASTEETDEMKLWLLKQKQTQAWENLPGLVGAIQILLQTGSNWMEDTGKTTIQLGNQSFNGNYIREVFDAKAITPDMSRMKITQENAAPGWGALHWQYYEDLDKITAAKTGLSVEKSLFTEKTSGMEKTLSPVTEAAPLQVGDKAVVRLTVRADRDFEYVLLKDMRASCFEPINQLSGVHWAQGAVYYLSPKDASMNYYFYRLPKGTYIFEYPLYVTGKGNYSNGITTIQCLYAPEFVSHTSGGRAAVR
ncbi:MAG: hypothetical protein LBF08_00855 [Dysgonamonadaceae bacterium]|jgi:hypothetical protein|nr:hypothetical protein [Dysgonamonadaceae bacterium]